MQSAALRTVSVTIEPIPYSVAMRKAEAAQTAEVAEEIARERQGFMTTARTRRRAQAASRREEELADGHAEMRFAGFVTVSAPSAEELERSASEVEHAAQLARLELQPPLRRAGGRLRLHPAAGPGASVRRARRAERSGHSATTAHFQAAYPFLAEGGLGAPGTYIGRDAYGGAWLYDPWVALRAEALGGAEHAGARRDRLRQVLLRQDLPLPPAGLRPPGLGARPQGRVRAAGAGARRGADRPGARRRGPAQPAQPARRARGAAEPAALGRPGGAAARARRPRRTPGCGWRSTRSARECGAGEPTLPMVVEALLHPREAMVAGVSAPSREDFAEANREAALALQRLCEGDLRGMFDGPTTAGLDLDAPLVVLDLTAVRDSAALGILMTCAAAWQQAILVERKQLAESGGVAGAKVISVVEEGWRVTGHIGVAEWLQQNFKLCRGLGVQNIVVVHRLSDFGASGAAGSREARIAEGLIADADTKVIYAQSPDQREALRGQLGLSATETELATTLRLGEALWLVGRRSFLVQHRLSRRRARADLHRRADGREVQQVPGF